MKKSVQRALCCPCGRTDILALGLCGTCYTLRRQDAEYFGGLREDVLKRDHYRCRVCDDPEPGVHHRVPGVSELHLMIALCAGCHAKIHRTKMMLTNEVVSPLLLELWREQHPNAQEQYVLSFDQLAPAAVIVPLFDLVDLAGEIQQDGAMENRRVGMVGATGETHEEDSYANSSLFLIDASA